MKKLGVKIYTTDWHTWYGIDYEDAADDLERLGVALAFVVNTGDEAPASGAAPHRVADKYRKWANEYDDLRFRDALARRGIKYLTPIALFLNPERLKRERDLYPINAVGEPMAQNGWYIGLCPSSDAYLEERLADAAATVKRLEPDGVFLMFIRFPGFWERWTPEYTRDLTDEYCFCRRCLAHFSSAAGIELPSEVTLAAQRILSLHRDAWTRWKCQLIASIVRDVRSTVREISPSTEIAINTLPLREAEYGGAIHEIFGQDAAEISPYADMFEVMTYHQVTKREPDWVASVANEVKARTGKPVFLTVLSRPRYLDGVYQIDGRAQAISATEFQSCVRAVGQSGADGLVLRWEDMLQDQLEGRDDMYKDLMRELTGG